MSTKKEFIKKLAVIQKKIVSTKSKRASNYSYRSKEDIYEAVKPLLGDMHLSVSDEVVVIGDRFYIKSTATICDGEFSQSAIGMAQEGSAALSKAGNKMMTDAQHTGSVSSYAGKYALGNLFGLDDVQDQDAIKERNAIEITPKSELQIKVNTFKKHIFSAGIDNSGLYKSLMAKTGLNLEDINSVSTIDYKLLDKTIEKVIMEGEKA